MYHGERYGSQTGPVNQCTPPRPNAKWVANCPAESFRCHRKTHRCSANRWYVEGGHVYASEKHIGGGGDEKRIGRCAGLVVGELVVARLALGGMPILIESTRARPDASRGAARDGKLQGTLATTTPEAQCKADDEHAADEHADERQARGTDGRRDGRTKYTLDSIRSVRRGRHPGCV